MTSVVKTFKLTSSTVAWTVPAGVTEATFECWGASGGGFSSDGDQTSLGAYTRGSLAVTAGDVYYVTVGGQGKVSTTATGPAGGFNGGGPGGNATDHGTFGPLTGCGGGGSTDIRHGGSARANRLMVAGGGGGRGGFSTGFVPVFSSVPTGAYPPYASDPSYTKFVVGGNGNSGFGGASGTTGAAAAGGLAHDNTGNVTSSGGGGGTQSAVGAAGAKRTGVTGANPGLAGGATSGGAGGAVTAGANSDQYCMAGGGGGGGYFPGGGGASEISTTSNPATGGGGGGGSSFVDPSFISTTVAINVARGITSTNVPAGSTLIGDGAASISYVQPPLTSGLQVITPNNTGTDGEWDVSLPIEFGWTFTPANQVGNPLGPFTPAPATSGFDFRYSSNGGTTWTTLTGITWSYATGTASSSIVHTVAGGFFTGATTYEAEVRVTDTDGVTSGWSDPVTFEPIALAGAPTITAPSAGATITAVPFNVTWTIPSGTQTDYQVFIVDDNGNTLVDSGDVASATKTYAASPVFPSVVGATISVRYKVSGGGGVWSTVSTVHVTLNNNPPTAPVVTLTANSDAATVTLTATQNATGGQTAVFSFDVYRTDTTNGTPEIRVVAGIQMSNPGSASWTDYTVACGVHYAYRVVARSEDGGTVVVT